MQSGASSGNDRSRPLEDWQKRLQLFHIEAAGGLNEANFKSICDDNPGVFGGPGPSSLRRSFQKELANLRKRTPQSYLRLLFNHGIKPSPQAIAAAETGLYLESVALFCCCPSFPC
jgi:hypothetical protein